MDLRNQARHATVLKDRQFGGIKKYQTVNVVQESIAQLVCPLRVVLKPVTIPAVRKESTKSSSSVPSHSSDTSLPPVDRMMDACDQVTGKPGVFGENPTSLADDNSSNYEGTCESSVTSADILVGERNLSCASRRTSKSDDKQADNAESDAGAGGCKRSKMVDSGAQTDVTNQSATGGLSSVALAEIQSLPGHYNAAAASNHVPKLMFIDSPQFERLVLFGTGWRLFVGQRNAGPSALRVDVHMMRHAAAHQAAFVGELDCRCTVQWTELDGCSVLPQAGDELRELRTKGLVRFSRPWSDEPQGVAALNQWCEKRSARHFRLSYALVSAVRPDRHSLQRLGNALAQSRSVLLAALSAGRIALLFPSSPYAHRRGFLPPTHSWPLAYLHCILVECRESSEPEEAQCHVLVPTCVANVADRVQRGLAASTVQKRIAFQRALRLQRAVTIRYLPKLADEPQTDSPVAAQLPACYVDLADLILQSQEPTHRPTRLPPWAEQRPRPDTATDREPPSSPPRSPSPTLEQQSDLFLLHVSLSPPKNCYSVPQHTVQQTRLALRLETRRLVELLLRQSKLYETERDRFLKQRNPSHPNYFSDSGTLDLLDWNLPIRADDSGTTVPFCRLSPAAALLWLRTPPDQRAGFKLRPAPTPRPPVQSPFRPTRRPPGPLKTPENTSDCTTAKPGSAQPPGPSKSPIRRPARPNATAARPKKASKLTALPQRPSVTLATSTTPLLGITSDTKRCHNRHFASQQNSVTLGLDSLPQPTTSAQTSTNSPLHPTAAATSHPTIVSPRRGRPPKRPWRIAQVHNNQPNQFRTIKEPASSAYPPGCGSPAKCVETRQQTPSVHANGRGIATDPHALSAVSKNSTSKQPVLQTVNAVQAQAEQCSRADAAQQSNNVALVPTVGPPQTQTAPAGRSTADHNGHSSSPSFVMPEPTTPASRRRSCDTERNAHDTCKVVHVSIIHPLPNETSNTDVPRSALEYVVKQCLNAHEPITNERIAELLKSFFNISSTPITQSASITKMMLQLGYHYQSTIKTWLPQNPSNVPVEQTSPDASLPQSNAPFVPTAAPQPAGDPLTLCAASPDPETCPISAHAASQSVAMHCQMSTDSATATESTSGSYDAQKRSIASKLRIKTVNRLMNSLLELNVPVTYSRISDEMRDASYAISEADLLEAMSVGWYLDEATSTWLPKNSQH